MTSPQPQTPTPGGSSGKGQGGPDPSPSRGNSSSGGGSSPVGDRAEKAVNRIGNLTQSPILPIGLMVIAGYLVWFGIHYWRSDVKWPSDPIKKLLRLQPIPAAGSIVGSESADAVAGIFQSAPGAQIIGGQAGEANLLLTGGNAAIAAAALKYQGTGYQFGGKADKPGNWDCSSFVFYVLAHDMGLPVLGGRWGAAGYPPNAHGPTAVQFKMYGTGVSTPAAGDIVAWNTHVGIALDANRIVSARTPSEGVGISTISGTSSSINETPVFRRVQIGG